MAVLRRFPRFFASAFAAPKAMLSRLKWTVDRHSDFLEAFEAENGIRIRRNYRGGITIIGGNAASGAWSGFVWYLGELKWDFSKVDADPSEEDAEGGLSGALGGIYLIISLSDGSTQWADATTGIEDVSADTHNFYPVCIRSGAGTEQDPYTYALSSNRVVGDIRVEFAPHICGEAL